MDDPTRRNILTAGAAAAAMTACLLSRPGKEELAHAFMKKAPFAFTMRRPGQVTRLCCSPAGD